MRSPCAIASALDIVGDRWSLLVMRDMLYHGKRTYGDFLVSPEGISTNILAERLKRLEHTGLIEKQAYQSNPLRYAYRPTKQGKAIKAVLRSLGTWGAKHIPKTVQPE